MSKLNVLFIILSVIMHGISIYGFTELGYCGGPALRARAIKLVLYPGIVSIILDSLWISDIGVRMFHYNQLFIVTMSVIISIFVFYIFLIITEKICCFR